MTPPATALAPAAARTLATTTKSVPFTTGTSPRWLLRMLPWVEVPGGTFRVNRRLAYQVGDGRVAFVTGGTLIEVVPEQLTELPPLRGLADPAALRALADRFAVTRFAAGEALARRGEPADRVVLVARGRVARRGPGEYGAATERDVLGSGDHFGSGAVAGAAGRWEETLVALTPVVALTLSRAAFHEVVAASAGLRAHLARAAAAPAPSHNRYGEAAVDLSAGHAGEVDLPGSYVAYDLAPRELPLSLAQTVLRVHTRVTDLLSDPMDQLEQQLRLTVTALRERQEHELLHHPEFGLLHHADPRQRLHPRWGPPTPADLDRLLARRRRTDLLLAHPRAVAAFGRECSRRGIYPPAVRVAGHPALSWRGVPVLPCDKIPVTAAHTSDILALRTGADQQGVVGLRPPDLPDQREPGLSVRLRGVDHKGVASYLVSAYHAVTALVPDALGILENVDIGAPEEET